MSTITNQLSKLIYPYAILQLLKLTDKMAKKVSKETYHQLQRYIFAMRLAENLRHPDMDDVARKDLMNSASALGIHVGDGQLVMYELGLERMFVPDDWDKIPSVVPVESEDA